MGSDDVPFYDRYYLGGLRDLRGFDYPGVGPREVTQDGTEYEPIGGDTFWMGSIEYSIPIMGPVRFATFFDIGNVSARPWNNSGYNVIGKGNENLFNNPIPGFFQFPAGNTGVYATTGASASTMTYQTSARCGWITAFPSATTRSTAPTGSSNLELVSPGRFDSIITL